MINPNNQENAEKLTAPSISTIYGALFTGEASLTPVAINPNREELIELKSLHNIADRIQEPQYTGIKLGSNPNDFTKIEFFFEFNPNELVSDEIKKKLGNKKFEDKVIVSYPIFINDSKVYYKDGSMIQIIDQHNQSVNIDYVDGKTIPEMIDLAIQKAQAENKHEYVINLLKSIDKKSARHAFNGEVLLYQTLFEHTLLSPHNVKSTTDVNGNKTRVPLNEFVLTAETDYSKIKVTPEEVEKGFLKVFAGDVSYLRAVINSKSICYKKDGTRSKVHGLLGVQESNGKYYQTVLSNPYICCISSENKRLNTYPEGESLLTKDAYNRALYNDKKPWPHNWGNSFKFEWFVIPEPSNDVSFGNTGPSAVNDDVPF
jgi:hypothetical protein